MQSVTTFPYEECAIGYTASAKEAKGLGKVDVWVKIGSD